MLFAEGNPAFFLELGELSRSPMRELMSPAEESRLDSWLASQAATATFFLDSIDELNLTRGTMKRALTRLARELEGNLQRASFFITTRPVSFDVGIIREYLSFNEPDTFNASADAFAELAMGRVKAKSQDKTDESKAPIWRMVSLTPLSETQIVELAREQKIANPHELLEDIKKRNAIEFSQRPQDLIELCTDWRDSRSIRSHRHQLEHNIKVKLLPRAYPGERAPLSAERALDGASRLALAALLTRRLTLRHSPEANSDSDSFAALDPRRILPGFSQDEISTLLERALFGFASYGRVRFHHQSVIEYLAAYRLGRLAEGGLSIRALSRLLFADAYDGHRVVKPTMRPVVAWLASEQPYIFEETLKREPEVLLNFGDPESLTLQQRSQALKAYVGKYGTGNWRGMQVPPIQIHRFAAKELSTYVARLLSKGIQNTEVRELLTDILAAAPSLDCADVAYDIATNQTGTAKERAEALSVLAALSDTRLPKVISTLKQDSPSWTNHQRKWALFVLFPNHVTPEDVCDVLALVTEPRRSAGDLGWMLARSTSDDRLSLDYLKSLCNGLTSLVLSGSKWSERRGRLSTLKPHLIEPLAATCARLLTQGCFDDEVIYSSIAVVKLVNNDSYSMQSVDELKRHLRELVGDARSRAFWTADSLYRSHHPEAEVAWRWLEATRYGPFNLSAEEDLDWIKAALSSSQLSQEERFLALESAIRMGPYNWEERLSFLETLKPCVENAPALSQKLSEMLKPSMPSPDVMRMEAEAKRQEEEAARNAEAKRSHWATFWERVALRPDEAFNASNSESTTWYLWSAMRQSGNESRNSGWDRALIERHFSPEIADKLRIALKGIWRQMTPSLRSERAEHEKNTYLAKWQLGLAAIAAEAEDQNWATHLTMPEAELAARYAPIELNGFPFWLTALALENAAAVDNILGAELIYELEEPATLNWHSSILQSMSQAHPVVACALLPRLEFWLNEKATVVREDDTPEIVAKKIKRLIEILLKFGDASIHNRIRELAEQELRRGLEDVFAPAWLPALILLSPSEGIDLLESFLSTATPSQEGVGVKWFAHLFGDRHDPLSLNPKGPIFTPGLLLRLLHLVHTHVRQEDDLHRIGAYTPGIRDHAEHARSAIFSALLESRGLDAWHAKLQLSQSPQFAEFRERAEKLAIETAAQDADYATMSEDDIVRLEQNFDAPILTRDDVFSLLRDRIDDIEDLLKTDSSPFEVWNTILDENVMRREISRELRNRSRGLYLVTQEAVTAEEKETDIRICSTSSDQEGVIELKIGDKKRSARELRDAIGDQLVRKYLAPDSRKAGLFLVTFSGRREHWEHPESGTSLDPKGLEALLKDECARLMRELGNEIRIDARVLDLRKRLPKEG